ncbi:MAG: hypothetical protein HQ541_01720 [Mariniphaga sp.]|nr:hypothetical protein [Mariniphaga sp.]
MNNSYHIPVIYEDNDIVVVNKPVNLPVHKNDFMPNDAPYLTNLVGEITGKWIFNVHRLDSKTSGLIVLALSKEIAHELTVQFEKKEVDKTYYAIVRENPGDGTFMEKVVVKKKSNFKKPAVTHFKTVKTIQTNISYKEHQNICLSLVEIKPETGRWHQIRQHFAKNRFDIIGDIHHGDFTLNKIILEKTEIRRLFLHASGLAFVHPVSGEYLHFKSNLPEEFEGLLNSYLVT